MCWSDKFTLEEIYKRLTDVAFTYHGFNCNCCKQELYVLRLGETVFCLRCKGCDGYRLVKASDVFEAEAKCGYKVELQVF